MSKENKLTRVLLVTHQDPDWDAIVSAFFWLLGNLLWFANATIRFAFVPPGKRYVGLVEGGWIIVHLDTGLIFCVKSNDYDHHQFRTVEEIKRNPSGAQPVYETFEKELSKFPWLDALRRETNEKDSGHSVTDEDPWLESVRRQAIDAVMPINQANGTNFRVEDDRTDICKMICSFSKISTNPNLPFSVTDEEKMRVGLQLLAGWHQKHLVNPEILKLFEDSAKLKKNGLRFAIFPDQMTVDSSDLRNTMRSNFYRDVDIYVTEFSYREKVTLAVTCIDADRVAGMNRLKKEIESLTYFDAVRPEIFLHSSNFVLYVTYDADEREQGLPYDRFKQAVLDCLHA